MFKKAEFIWQNSKNKPDEYVEFLDTFFLKNEARLGIIKISVDSNYVLKLNGQLVGFSQYSDYPHYKIYDCIDIAQFLIIGENKLEILVWYYGVSSQTYAVGDAGLIFEISCDENVVSYSGKQTLCRLSKQYYQYRKKLLTEQIGFSFCYNTREPKRENLFAQAVIRSRDHSVLQERPIKKLCLGDKIQAHLLDETKQVYDLGKESNGFVEIQFRAKKNQKLKIIFGEYVAKSGNLFRFKNHEDNSVEIIANGKTVKYSNYFRRLGCRYFQIISNASFQIDYIGIQETYYPVKELEIKIDKSFSLIYQTSLRTLRLCMQEHYEDCPWREQSLYTLDSFIQMLCGFYAFADKNLQYAKANLRLIKQGSVNGKLLPHCFPSNIDININIPCYSLIYILSVDKYIEVSDDISFINEVLPVLDNILEVFKQNKTQDELLHELAGHWNFYEWSDGLEGMDKKKNLYDWNSRFYKHREDKISLILNCFYILALSAYDNILKKVGKIPKYNFLITNLRKQVYLNFFNRDKCIYTSYLNENHYSVLCNALAVLAECAPTNEVQICEKMMSGHEMIQTTLCMKYFQYEALLKVSDEYQNWILDDIKKNYGYMLQKGATSFWETLLGEDEFDGSGSLCHGWSALPIYFYHKCKETSCEKIKGISVSKNKGRK